MAMLTQAFLLLTGSSRLVNSQKVISDDLGFYVETYPDYIYKLVAYKDIIFSFTIPAFDDDSSVAILKSLEKDMKALNGSSFQGTSTNERIINRMIYDITSSFYLVGLKLKAIQAYANSSNPQEIFSTAPCTIEITELLTVYNLKTYADAFGKVKGFEIAEDVQQGDTENNAVSPKISIDDESFLMMRDALQRVLEETHQFLYATDLYLEGLEALSNLKLSTQFFDHLKDKNCFDQNPRLDYLQIRECEFFIDKVICSFTMTNPVGRKKYIKMEMVPYFGHELEFKNLYKEPNSTKLVFIECKHDVPVKHNCKITKADSPCMTALSKRHLREIQNECTFVPSYKSTPIKTRDGVLLPSENLVVDIVEDGEWKNLDVFGKNRTSPVVLALINKFVVKDEDFVYVFEQMFRKKRFIKSILNSEEMAELKRFLLSHFPLSDDMISILTQSSYGGGIFFMSVVLIALGVKLYKNTKLVRAIPKRPKKPYSKELETFLHKKGNKK